MKHSSSLAFLTLILGACTNPTPSKDTAAEEPAEAWDYEAHVAKRTAEIDAAPVECGGVLFVGDSITDAGGDWTRWFPGVVTSNQGIGGDQTRAVLARMDQVTRGTPERVFLMIGTNDLPGGTPKAAAEGAIAVAAAIRRGLPDAELYVQSVLPRGTDLADEVRAVNARLAAAAGEGGYTYLDLHSRFATPEGTLRPELTYDDLHLEEAGYALWAELIDECVRRGCDGE